MIKLPKKLYSRIFEHLQSCAPKEGCGFIVGTDKGAIFVPSENVHPDSTNYAMVTNWHEAEDKGEVLAFVHSHPNNNPEASPADIAQCEAHGVPWLIVALPSLTCSWVYPTGFKTPLLGRPFVYGVFDCGTLIRDWYESEMGIVFDLDCGEWEWWKDGKNHYVDSLTEKGFYQLEPHETLNPKYGDVLLMQVASKVPNHGGIYIGGGLFIHHMSKHASRRDLYLGMWQEKTVGVWRHKDAKDPVVR